jgi:ligand-binding sensor domain-containing protein
LVGTGGLWEWKKIELESQNQEIERAVKTTDLREKENDQYAKILDLTNEYINAVNDYSKVPTPQLHNKIAQLKSQLDVIKDNFTTLENKLTRSSKDVGPGIFQ